MKKSDISKNVVVRAFEKIDNKYVTGDNDHIL